METIKKEKKADLEQLLNSLIEKGWKPFGDNAIKFDYDGMKTNRGYGAITYLYRDSYIDDYGDKVEYEEWQHQFNNRELVSKESGLWQFVCENHLYIYKMGENKNFIQDHFKNEYNECCYQYLWDKSCYEYYLLESSLKDDSELEDFLLNSIKLD